MSDDTHVYLERWVAEQSGWLDFKRPGFLGSAMPMPSDGHLPQTVERGVLLTEAVRDIRGAGVSMLVLYTTRSTNSSSLGVWSDFEVKPSGNREMRLPVRPFGWLETRVHVLAATHRNREAATELAKSPSDSSLRRPGENGDLTADQLDAFMPGTYLHRTRMYRLITGYPLDGLGRRV